ncbi:MAG: AAA family ATPase [Actinophytocola sp.]|nr:AAA family ATPase [Actinophytocola sp.]
MVGREHECDRLGAALTTARDGRGQVVLIAGEPGIGKTRLAEEAARIATTLGMSRAWGRAVDDDGSPPFWPFRLAIRSLAADGDRGHGWPRAKPSPARPRRSCGRRSGSCCSRR